MQLCRRLLVAVAAVCALGAPRRAHAFETPAPRTTLAGLVEDGHRWVMAALASPIDARTPPPADESGAATPPADFAPHASLVARDWRGSLHVAGRTMLLDDVRPSASNRSVLARLTCDAELSPYVQIGAGQWRIDPVLFPSLPTHETLAGQIGAGFQIDAGGVQIAGEATWTILYREGGSVARDDVVAPILAVVVAAQTRF